MSNYYKVSEKRMKELYHYYLELQYLRGRYNGEKHELKESISIADVYMDRFDFDMEHDKEVELLP